MLNCYPDNVSGKHHSARRRRAQPAISSGIFQKKISAVQPQKPGSIQRRNTNGRRRRNLRGCSGKLALAELPARRYSVKQEKASTRSIACTPRRCQSRCDAAHSNAGGLPILRPYRSRCCSPSLLLLRQLTTPSLRSGRRYAAGEMQKRRIPGLTPARHSRRPGHQAAGLRLGECRTAGAQ
jgi:hypothetical protein